MKFEKFNITLSLPVERVNQLAGLTVLMNAYDMKHGGTCQLAEVDVLASVVDTYLEECLKKEISLFAEQEPETVSNAEEASVLASAVADAREEEPETLISVRDASGVVRMVTLDEMEEMREAAQGIYAGEPPEPQDEPEEPDADVEEEEPETVSNAEEKPSPLIKDNSDGYFYYLEHGQWPPDDEVLAGADVPCTGDYGLSDCLVVTQSTLDFVDAFFT